MSAATDHPVPWWVRAVLWLAAAQALLLLLALVQPSSVDLLVPWPASPLNARFIASLYVALGVGVVLCSLAPSFREMRIVLVGIGVATALLLVLTVWRMTIHPHELAKFPTFWIVFYVVDPLLVGLVFLRLGWGGQGAESARPRQAFWVAQAVLFGVAGIVLLLTPGVAQALWPWAITEPQAQLYSAFFITLAVTSALAARERSWGAVRWVVFMIGSLAILVLGVSVLHLARFTRTGGTVIWMLVLAAEAVVCGGLFLRHTLRRPSLVTAR